MLDELKVNEYDENEAKIILAKIKEAMPDTKITLEDIKRKYSAYKAIFEQDKIKWLKGQKSLPLDDFVDAVNIVSKEELEGLAMMITTNVFTILRSIASMGTDKYLELKSKGELQKLMSLEIHAEKLWDTMSQEEIDLLIELSHYSRYNETPKILYYLYYDFIKNQSKKEIEILLQATKDEWNFHGELRKNKNASYKHNKNIFVVPTGAVMGLIKKMNSQDIMELREKTKVPLNVIFAAVIILDIPFDNILGDEQEKLIMNYHKFRMSRLDECDKAQMKELLLDLPEDLSTEYEERIKDCIFGRLKDFNIRTFKDLQNYEEFCNKRIMQEFESNEDVEKIKELILKGKFKNYGEVKRTLYYYRKYLKETAEENKLYSLFNGLINAKNKDELLSAYNALSEASNEFTFDNLFDTIRSKIEEIAKDDVVARMKSMSEILQTTEVKKKDGADVIDLTGQDFNLLISVIASEGSPYFVDFHNNFVAWSEFSDTGQKLSYNNMESILTLENERRIAERYKKDPLKNKQRCVSSIDEDFLGHITAATTSKEQKQRGRGLILAYFPTDKKDISLMGNKDLNTRYSGIRTDKSRKRIPHDDNLEGICYLKLEDLNACTIGDDNEIIVDSYPGAIVCFDEMSDISKETAKRMNLPILFIDSKQQFKVMSEKLNQYYDSVRERLGGISGIDDSIFETMFNEFEPDRNVIHRAFKIANSFCYLDDEEYPKEEIIQIFGKMKGIVRFALSKCSEPQKQRIARSMLKEANIRNLRYGHYNRFIDFEELKELVSDKQQVEEVER